MNSSNNKKVVHITTVHQPFDTRIYHKQCKTLAENGFDVTLIASYHEDIEKVSEKSQIKLITVPKAKNRLQRMTKTVMDTYKQAKRLNAQIYHIHDPELIPVGLLLKKKDNIVIYDVHEDYITSIRQKKYLKYPVVRAIAAAVFGFIETFFTKNFKIVLAEKYYKERFAEGTWVLNYPIINEPGEKDIKKAAIGSNSLIYTGGVTEDRGAFIHAKIPSLIDNMRVTYVGLCSEEVADKIYSIAEDKKACIEIEGIGRYIPREEIDRRYREGHWLAGLAIFPTTEHYKRKELTKFFEYMYVGLPIICSNFPVWQELINKYKCGVTVDPCEEKEIRSAIIYLRDNPDIAHEMGQNGKDAVLKELNWESEGKKLVELYKELIARI